MSTYVFLETIRERKAKAAQLLKLHGFRKCGLCGMEVKAAKGTLKCDGWHWHSDCWSAFLKG